MADEVNIEYINTHFDAYEPTEWACGDTITAEKLNKAETRIGFVGGGYSSYRNNF